MWLRLIGLFLVVGSCALYYAQAPRGAWWHTTLVEAPLPRSGATTLSFIADADSPCNILVRYKRAALKQRNRSPAFSCVGADDNTQVLPLIRPWTRLQGEEREDGVARLRVTAGHRYTVVLKSLPSGAERIKRSAHVIVQYNGRRLTRDPVEGMVALCSCGVWCFIGLVFTFLSRRW